MQNMSRYSRPPVVEAALVIGFAAHPSTDLPILKSLADSLGEEYPTIAPRLQGTVQVSFGGAVGSSASQAQNGFVLQHRSGRRVVHLALDTLMVSFLRPYTDWDELTKEARRLWDLLRESFKPAELDPTSILVRFINQIEAEPGKGIEEFVTVYPEVPDLLLGPSAQFYLRMNLPFKDFSLTIQEGFVASMDDPARPSVLLDLALARAVSRETLWEEVARSRGAKNEVFEAIITQRSREAFK